MEKALNTVLYVLFAAFGLYMAYSHYEENYVPVPYQQPEAHAAPLFKLGEKAPLEEEPWFAAHFATPIPANGEAPEGWTEEESSLDSKACGDCHAEQLAQWEGSAHAGAMDAAVWGHVVDLSDADAADCQSCHAPMSEQLPKLADGAENPAFIEDQRQQGVTCAGCHVRAHERMGPPADAPAAEDAPHGGFTASEPFTDTRYCASCHEQPADGPGLKDKRLIETVSEWTRTDMAAEGQSCQSCHMQEGSHAWAGIEDAEFTKTAFLPEAEVTTAGGRFEPVRVAMRVTNVGAAHRFPSGAQPQVQLVVEQADASAAPIPGTQQLGVIGRRLSEDATQELLDTRLLPGETFEIAYSAARHPDAVTVYARVEVLPRGSGHGLHGYRVQRSGDAGAALLTEAEAAQPERYVAWERHLELVVEPAATEE